MKSTRTMFRTLSIGIGLALLVVTGTAAMMAAFSNPLTAPGTQRQMLVLASLDQAQSQAMASDSVLYERVTRADGSQHWVLTEAPATGMAQRDAPTQALASATAIRASFTLQAKPAGLAVAMKQCGRASSYDLSCQAASY